jgi:hypothetical protein
VVFIHKTADGQTLSVQDKRLELVISPTIVLSIYYTISLMLQVVEVCVWRDV